MKKVRTDWGNMYKDVLVLIEEGWDVSGAIWKASGETSYHSGTFYYNIEPAQRDHLKRLEVVLSQTPPIIKENEDVVKRVFHLNELRGLKYKMENVQKVRKDIKERCDYLKRVNRKVPVELEWIYDEYNKVVHACLYNG